MLVEGGARMVEDGEYQSPQLRWGQSETGIRPDQWHTSWLKILSSGDQGKRKTFIHKKFFDLNFDLRGFLQLLVICWCDHSWGQDHGCSPVLSLWCDHHLRVWQLWQRLQLLPNQLQEQAQHPPLRIQCSGIKSYSRAQPSMFKANLIKLYRQLPIKRKHHSLAFKVKDLFTINNFVLRNGLQ